MSIRAVLALNVLLSTGFAVVSLPAPAAATEQATVQVHYGDLDLATDTGVAQLNQRIQSAATHVCGPVDNRDLAQVGRFLECRRTAAVEASARAQQAIALARTGAQVAALPTSPSK